MSIKRPASISMCGHYCTVVGADGRVLGQYLEQDEADEMEKALNAHTPERQEAWGKMERLLDESDLLPDKTRQYDAWTCHWCGRGYVNVPKGDRCFCENPDCIAFKARKALALARKAEKESA